MRQRGRTGRRAIQGKYNRLFLKILGCFLSLLIPIIIIGVVEYSYSAHLMEREFASRISTNLESASESMDSYIQTSQITGVNFLNDETVQRLLMPKDKQTLADKAELWRLPRILQRHENVVSSFTDSTFVYVDNQDVYVSGGANSFDSFFDKMYRYEEYDSAFWTNLLQADKFIELLPATTVIQDNINTKQVVPLVLFSRVGNYKAVMVVNLSVSTVERALAGNAVFDSTQFVVLDGQGNKLYDESGYLDNIPEAELAGAFPDGSLTREMKVGGKRYAVAHIKSDLYGWDYYSFTPYSEFNRHTGSIMQMTLLLCLVFIVMGIIFSFVFSLNIYNPIRNISRIITQGPEGDSAGHERSSNEFDVILQGINRLSDSNRQFKMKYSKHTSEYVEYSLLFILRGHTLNEEAILRETLRVDFGFEHPGFVCCTVLFDFKEPFYADIQDTERPQIIGGIKKIIWKFLGSALPAYVAEYRPNLFVCLVNLAEPRQVTVIKDAFQQMLGVFGYDIRMYYDIAVGIGTYYEGINEIGISFNEAMTAVSKRDKEQRFDILCGNRLCDSNRYEYSLYDEQRILNTLKIGDELALGETVEAVLSGNSARGISYEQYLGLLRDMYTSGVRFLSEKGLQADLADKDEFRLLLEAPSGQMLRETDELKELLLDFYGRILEVTKGQKGRKPGNLVSLIEQYIRDNYVQDLGLEQIAAEMGVSVKYVSRVFVEKTGMYVTDYINLVRVRKACELLASTDLKVHEIAERVGILSRTTFLRVFKKVEGITPNEYRALHRRQE